MLLALALRGLAGPGGVTFSRLADEPERASRGGWVMLEPDPLFGARDLRCVLSQRWKRVVFASPVGLLQSFRAFLSTWWVPFGRRWCRVGLICNARSLARTALRARSRTCGTSLKT